MGDQDQANVRVANGPVASGRAAVANAGVRPRARRGAVRERARVAATIGSATAW
jgi:hypothetical protein